jgi:excinuclease ABC subunit C
MEIEHRVKNKVKSLPDKPGVYQYFDETGTIIYVGKAKNLKKRVSSYFTKSHENRKTAVLVRRIADIKFIVVETELDALLLENSLIKKYQPRYNIEWRDDKTYPWICVKKERFPRIFPTRTVIRDGSKYFGPYASVKVMNTLLDLAKQLHPLRNCNFNLSQENIEAKKFKVCLEYHLGNCKGPCEGLQEEAEYDLAIASITDVIKGNTNRVIKNLKGLMDEHAAKFQFEKAQLIKEKLELLERYQAKSTVVSPTVTNVDVYSIDSNVKSGYVNYMKVMNGTIVQAHTIELKKRLDESDEALLEMAIVELRQRFDSSPKEILVPFALDLEIEGINLFVPQRGDKKSLLDLSIRNAKYFRLEKQKQERLVNPERHTERILETLKKDLRLQEMPRHIECFDNSNIQGTHPVAACVVFRDAKPAKKDYRHFNIKTVVGPDDFASMEEVVYRRYKRLQEEEKSLPQLIVIDGGKGQLSSAVKSLEKLGLRGKISIVGIAKKLEEIYFPEDSVPLYIDKRSESLKLIQHLRNEAHRFGITHHRNRRSKSAIQSELKSIEGIGEKTMQMLLKKFKSVKRIKEAALEDLEEVVGKSKAALVFKKFNN